MVSAPRGSSEPAIHFLRAVTGLAGVRNQVQARAVGDRLQRMLDVAGGDHHVRAGGGGDLAGLDLGDACRRATAPTPDAPAIASISGVMRATSGDVLGACVALRRLVVEPVDVGQQHQEIGAHHGGDARGEPVVVAVADLGGRDRVVLVDHRHAAPFQQLGDGRARVEIAAALFGVAERDQHLAGGDAVRAERLRPGARQRDLADRGGGLAVLELERTAPAA